jgi:hypothetical protein
VIGAWSTWGLTACGLLFTRAAFGQTTGVLTGAVVDASTLQPVPDVVVTATSPALQGEQTVVTDQTGSYRIPQLPPGDYTIRLDKETYRPYASGSISLRLNSTIRVNVSLLPSALKEDVVVIAKPPTVDVGSATTGLTLNAEVSQRIAVNPPGSRAGALRSFESLALLVPGARGDSLGVSLSGTSPSENRYQVDGLAVNNVSNGLNDSPLITDFIKEVTIATGGYMPEFGRATGGVFDVVTKSGSNDFHGSFFSSMTLGALEGTRTQVRTSGSSVSDDVRLSALRDFGFELGGPILKDKLWFHAGLNIAFQDNEIKRRLNRLRYERNADGSLKLDENGGVIPEIDERGFQLADPIPGTENTYLASRRSAQYIGKLTWLIDPSHTLTLSAHGTPSRSGGDGRISLSPVSGTTYFGSLSGFGPAAFTGVARTETSDIHSVSLKLASAFMNKRLLLDTTLGVHHAVFKTLPADGSEVGSGQGLANVPGIFWQRGYPGAHSIADFQPLPPNSGCDPAGTESAIFCPVTTYRTGGPGHTDQSTLNRYQGKIVATYLASALGQHVVKAGVDVEVTTRLFEEANTGGVWIAEGFDGASFLTFHYGSLTSPNDVFVPKKRTFDATSTLIGGFVQDSWSILDKVTVNAGVRYDAQVIRTTEGTGMTLPAQWSPRVGAIYDFTRQGRSKLFANFARYYENVPLAIGDNFVGRQITIGTVPASACDPRNPQSLANCDAPENRIPVGATWNPNRKWTAIGGGRAPVDPDIEAQSSDEIVLGGEYEIFQGARAGVSYTHRYMRYVIEDMSRDEGTTFFIGNPGYGVTSDFPRAKRDYDAMTLYFEKTFASQWMALASYTLSYLRGNYSGLSQPGDIFPGANTTGDFDIISLLPNRDGPLPGDRTHALRLYGAKAFSLPGSFEVSLGASYEGVSGAPLNVLGAHPYYGAGNVFILPRGSGGRLPWVHTVDTNISAGYRLSKDSVLSLSLNVFNLFNFQAETNRDQNYTYAAVRPIKAGKLDDLEVDNDENCMATNSCRDVVVAWAGGSPLGPQGRNPNYGRAMSYQTPRQIRIGAKVTF